eukprot:77730-Pleurochrysis_carterae.AAC.1
MVSATRRVAALRKKSMCASIPVALAACSAAPALAMANRAPVSACSRRGSSATTRAARTTARAP